MGGDKNGVLFRDFAWQSWLDKYGTSPPWGKREFANLHEARSRIDTEQVARDAWKAFLDNQEPFFAGHQPGKFLLELGRFVAKAALKPTPRKQRSFPGAARAAAMAAVVREVTYDNTIPDSMKQNEMKKRWAEIPLDL